MPGHDRPDGLEVARVGSEFDRDVGARRADVLALHAEVVLDVAGALDRRRIDVALELGEDRLVALAHDVGQHVESAPVRHAEHGGVEARVGGVRQDLVEHGNRRLGTFDAEALRADVLGGEELLERLGGVQPLEDAVLALLRVLLDATLELLLDPLLLVGVLDVHVLDADRAAVGVAQHTEEVAEAHLGHTTDTVGEELAVEVPDRQAVGGRIELLGSQRLLPAQRIEIGHQVTAHAVDADQLGDRHLLGEHRLFAVHRVGVGPPLDRLVRHVERVEDVLVEVVLAEQQLVDPLQEHPGLGALDDPVVVRAGDGDDLADADRAQAGTIRTLELGRVVDAADADDHGLARHQSGHRLDGADRARVGEADVGAHEVVDGQLVGLDLADDLLVRGEEAGEVERVGVAQHRHHERAAAVGLLDVDRETHVDVVVDDQPRLAVGALDVGVLHRRHLVGDGAHDRETDQVGEADLGLATAGTEAVDHLAVDLEQLRRHVAEARGGGHRETALHVGGDRGAGTADRLAGLVLRGGRCRPGRRCRRSGSGCSCGCGAGWAGAAGAGAGSWAGAAALRCRWRGRRRTGRPRPRPGPRWRSPPPRPRSAPATDSRRRTPATTRSPTTDRRRTARTSPPRATSSPRTPTPDHLVLPRAPAYRSAAARPGPAIGAHRGSGDRYGGRSSVVAERACRRRVGRAQPSRGVRNRKGVLRELLDVNTEQSGPTGPTTRVPRRGRRRAGASTRTSSTSPPHAATLGAVRSIVGEELPATTRSPTTDRSTRLRRTSPIHEPTSSRAEPRRAVTIGVLSRRRHCTATWPSRRSATARRQAQLRGPAGTPSGRASRAAAR